MKQNIDVNSKMFTKNRIDFRISFGIHIIYKVYLGRFNVLKDIDCIHDFYYESRPAETLHSLKM